MLCFHQIYPLVLLMRPPRNRLAQGRLEIPAASISIPFGSAALAIKET
jgi:hypothetical protein